MVTHLLSELVFIAIVGIAAARLSQWLRLPDIIICLAAGILLGPAATGWVAVKLDSHLSELILTAGAALILFEGGMELTVRGLRRTMVSVVVLATLGVVITGAVTGAVVAWVWGLPLAVALLGAAVIASTDPATLIPVFAQVPIREKVRQTVIAESAFNDAIGAILTFTLLGIVTGGAVTAGAVAWDLGVKVGLGTVAGLLAGGGAVMLTEKGRIALPVGDWLEFSPQLMLVCGLGSFLLAEHIGGSGFMAVFIAGLIVELDHPEAESFVQGITTLARMFIFIILGANIDFGILTPNLGGGLLVIAVFMLVARPLTVFLCTLPDRAAGWERNELIFMCWVRETGVIPAALLGLLAAKKVPHFDKIYTITFLAILLTIVVQAGTTGWLARKLGLLAEGEGAPAAEAPPG